MFDTRNEVMAAVQSFLFSKDVDFYARGITKLVERWNYIIDNDGKYFVE